MYLSKMLSFLSVEIAEESAAASRMVDCRFAPLLPPTTLTLWRRGRAGRDMLSVGRQILHLALYTSQYRVAKEKPTFVSRTGSGGGGRGGG